MLACNQKKKKKISSVCVCVYVCVFQSLIFLLKTWERPLPLSLHTKSSVVNCIRTVQMKFYMHERFYYPKDTILVCEITHTHTLSLSLNLVIPLIKMQLQDTGLHLKDISRSSWWELLTMYIASCWFVWTNKSWCFLLKNVSHSRSLLFTITPSTK